MEFVPIYEYRCEQGHDFEVMQRMSDEPLATCTTCSAPVQRVLHPPAIHFKGSGFHNTDYGTRKRQREQAENKSSESKDSKPAESSSSSSSSSEKSGEKSGEKKSSGPSKPEAAAA
jgi:putative FmdB family regulatory protein